MSHIDINAMAGVVPDDVEEAFQAMWLAVMRHKLDGWREISQNAMVNTLYALQQMALQEEST